MHVDEAIRRRVSVKEYRGDPVPEDEMLELLELALLAPNHRMTQPLTFRILTEDGKRAYAEALAGRKAKNVDDPGVAEEIRNRVVGYNLSIPTMVAVLVNQHENPEIREEDWATAFMAIQNLSLAAVGRGYGTHIKTGAVMDEPSLRAALEAGEDQRVAAIVFVGEPAELPDAKPRAPVEEVTRRI